MGILDEHAQLWSAQSTRCVTTGTLDPPCLPYVCSDLCLGPREQMLRHLRCPATHFSLALLSVRIISYTRYYAVKLTRGVISDKALSFDHTFINLAERTCTRNVWKTAHCRVEHLGPAR